MSNPDLPGPYWQDQDNASHPDAWSGRPNGVPQDGSPWEDDAGFWRSSERGARSAGPAAIPGGQDDHDPWWERARPARSSRRAARGGAGPDQPALPAAEASAPRHNGRAADYEAADYGADYGLADRDHAGGRRRMRDPDAAGERTGRFSQTADDLRNRLGLRGSALGRGNHDYAGSPSAASPDDDAGQPNGAGWPIRNQRGGYRGSRRAGSAAASGAGGYGDAGGSGGPGGYDEGVAGSRTALRDQPDDWPGDYGTRRNGGVKPAQGPGRGGRGGGRGGRGGRGGGWDGDDQAPRGLRQRIRHSWQTGSWWRHWSVKKVLGLMGAGIAGFILLCIAGFFVIYSMTPIRSAADQQALWQSSSVYFSDGKLLGTFANDGQSRQILTPAQIPTVMDQAMVAAEDRHFYTEGGISVPGIVRAAYEDLFGNGGLQGGSTITEQYAKNYYAGIGTSRSMTTKIKEIFVAIKLAHARSKSWIMTQYLNIVPFGPETYGVGAAAQQYFGINLASKGAKLTAAQAAMLAAMPNEPGVFNPDPSAGADFTALVARWQYVVANMARDGAISQTEADNLCANCSLGGERAQKAFEKNIKIVPPGQNSGYSGYRFYLMNMVESELEARYGFSSTQINTDGLKITTTFNESMIKALNHAVYLNERTMKADGRPLPSWAHVGATLIDPKTGGILAIYGGPGVSMSKKACDKVLCWDNTAEIPHQPGSSFKPYVLATAVSGDMNVKTSVLNAYSPICVPPDWTLTDRIQLSTRMSVSRCLTKQGQGYWYATDSSSLGGIPVPEAAAISSNPGFEDLAHRVGIDNIIRQAASLGVGSTPYFTFGGANDLASERNVFGKSGSVTLSLGASGADLTSIEQASTFATLADDGVYHLPHVISSLTAANGNKVIPVKIPSHQALNPQQAADEDYALSFDNQSTYAADGATGYPAAAWNRPVIAKTGTTDTAQDAWFIGAIPQDALAVTLYTNQQSSVQGSQSLNVLPQPPDSYLTGGYGGAWPATIWHTFMTAEFNNLPVIQLPTPNFGLPFVKWNQVPKAPKHKQTCGNRGHGFGFGHGHGNKCCQPGAFGQPCGNPSPTPTCQGGFGQPCGGSPTSTPSPSPTCPGGGFGPPCGSPTPSPTPTPTPSCSPFTGPPCTPSPGVIGGARAGTATTTALVRPAVALTPQQLAIKVRQALLSQRL
ncbi:MAG: transglycosylase domain-containing protein [Streptosporangiaceae bacterium]